MLDVSQTKNQVQNVSDFKEFLSTQFQGTINAICLPRNLIGDFSEIVNQVDFSENMITINEERLNAMQLSEQGQLAREILLNDLDILHQHGASPTLNVIKHYEKDDVFPFLPTDVYSFHVDRSPVPTDTILCTYFGESSDIISNTQAVQKVLIPEIRDKLKKLHDGPENEFEAFLSEYFFDMHYQAKPNSSPTSLGIGNFWRLAVDHPKSPVPPCIHRAPVEKNGQKRLLMIC